MAALGKPRSSVIKRLDRHFNSEFLCNFEPTSDFVSDSVHDDLWDQGVLLVKVLEVAGVQIVHLRQINARLLLLGLFD